MQQELIEHLSKSFEKKNFSSSCVDQRVYTYLKSKKIGPNKGPISISFDEKHPIERIDQWRTLLKASLLTSIKSVEENELESLKESWFSLFTHHKGSEYQLEQAYAALTAHLLKIAHTPQKEIFQLENGFSPLKTDIQYPMLNTPFIEWHAELGIIWALFGHLKQDSNYKNAAKKIAEWHKKNLDYDLKPFKGFLCSHHLSQYENVLLIQGVLFHVVSLLFKDLKMAFVAKQHFGWLLQLHDLDVENIQAHAVLLLYWMDSLFKEQLTPQMPDLSREITDSLLPLVGMRKSNLSFLLSFLGMNVGLGSYKFHDIEISAFGPQLQLLGEERLFGFLGCNPIDQNFKDSYKCDFATDSFSLKGTLGLPKPSLEADSFDLWHFPSSWFDCSLEYHNESLHISLRPLQNFSKCFFVFYVAAEKCLIEGEEKIFPYSLNQYEGSASSLSLQSTRANLTLQSLQKGQKVKVIPLEGHHSFWGANYLIAYHLNNKYSTFEWKITTKEL